MLGAKDNKKPAAYCRIIDYVEHDGSEGERLKDVLQFTCLLGLLSNRKGKAGVTLMWPTSKVLGEIEAAIYKGDSASMWSAAQRLRAHILCDVYNEKTPFVTGKQAVNCQMPSRGIAVKKATAKTVEFEKSANSEPATATLEEGFKVMSDPANPRCVLSIWRMKSGEMPTDGPETKVIKPLKKLGGNEQNVAATCELRCQIMAKIEQLYAVGEGKSDVYMTHYASLFAFLKEHHPDILYEIVIPLTSCTPIDLYLILEPYSTKHLISHEVIEAWWKSNKHGGCEEVIKMLNEENHLATADLYDNKKRVAMLKKVNEARARMLRAICGDFRNCVEVIKNEYQQLQSSSGNFWPATIKSLYDNVETKIAHDDLRYVVKLMMSKLTNDWSAAGFSDVKSMIEQCLKGNCPRANLIHGGTVKYAIDGGRDLQPQIYALCASDYLWYFPHTIADSDAGAVGMKLLDDKAEVGRKGLWRDIVHALHRTTSEAALDSHEVTTEAHRELYSALRQLISDSDGDESHAVLEAKRVLSKHATK